MVRTADETKKVLSIGHQRHYSTLYDHGLAIVQSGVLGTVKHIRALWHRNNTWIKPDGTSGDSWSPPVPEADQSVDYKKYGYKSLRELVCWRLFNRTGGGLMAELGSHQLDACSLFLNKAHPVYVQGVGGKFFFDDDRECDDHVYCTYLMPNGVVVTYSSINTNALSGYGEVVTGTKGTLMILNERDVMLFKEREPEDKWPSPDMRIKPAMNPKLSMTSTGSTALMSDAALADLALQRGSQFTPAGTKETMTNRGYREEMEAFAFAIRNPGAQVRCSGRVAMADAVMALSANVAMRGKRRLDFKPTWYDPASSDVPDGKNAALAGAGG
jgi:predicted dehydrogenase